MIRQGGLPLGAFILQVPSQGSSSNGNLPITFSLPNPNTHSMANLPTSLDIENNNQTQNRLASNQFIIYPQGNYPPSNNALEYLNNKIKGDLGYYKNNRRIIKLNQEVFVVQHSVDGREPIFDSTATSVHRVLYNQYGVYLTSIQIINLQQLGKQIFDKVCQDRAAQAIFFILQFGSCIPSICYLSLSKELFQQLIASDIYTLIILVSNVLIVATRYLLLLKLTRIIQETSNEDYETPQVLLFLINVRDRLGIKSSRTLSRSQIQNSITKGFDTCIVWVLNFLNIVQYLTLFFSIYFIVLQDDFKFKIHHSNNISSFLAMTYFSLLVPLFYIISYSLYYGATGLIIAVIGIVTFVGLALYRILYLMYEFGKSVSRLLCGTRYTSSSFNGQQIFPAFQSDNNNIVQIYADAYVKRNTKTITYNAQKCKDTLCSICLEEYTEGVQSLKQMICCKSAFHFACIQNWAREKKTCPNCRSEDVFVKKQKKRLQRFSQLQGLFRENRQNIPQQNQNSNPQQLRQIVPSNVEEVEQSHPLGSNQNQQANTININLSSQQPSLQQNSQQIVISNSNQTQINQNTQAQQQQQQGNQNNQQASSNQVIGGLNILQRTTNDNHELNELHRGNQNLQLILNNRNISSELQSPQQIVQQQSQNENISFTTNNNNNNNNQIQQREQLQEQFMLESQNPQPVNIVLASNEEIGSNTQFLNEQPAQIPQEARQVSLHLIEQQIDQNQQDDSPPITIQ